MTAAVAAPPPGSLEPREGALWAAAFAAVLALHLAAGLWLLGASPETGPVDAPEPIAVIDLPPAPMLPDAVTSQALPPSDVVDIAPPTASVEMAGAPEPDLAPQAVETVEAAPSTAEAVPPPAADALPVPVAPPVESVATETAPPQTVPALPAETPTAPPPAEAASVVPPEIAAEPPLEVAPVVPDAAVVLPGVALPQAKPEVVPPPAPAKQPETREAEAKPKEAAAKRKTDTKPERTAPKKAAGPAAETPKAGTPRTGSAPRAAGGGPAADALKQYQAKVRADIEREVRRISLSRTGVAAIRFSFSRAGALSAAAIARSSGDPAIDRAALQAVKRASPFPAAPSELPQASFTLTVPIRMK